MGLKRVGELAFYAYNAAIALSLPLFPIAKLLARKRGKLTLTPRLLPSFKEARGKLLIHASSVGEINSLKPLLEKLNGEVALTLFTDYGLERAEKLFPKIPKRLLPVDFFPLAYLFLKKSSPKAILIYETEIWPSLMRASCKLSIPLFFISGKIGEKTYKRLKLFKGFLKKELSHATFLARTEKDLERARELGFGKTLLVGDLKFDYEPPKTLPPLKIEGNRKVVIWGSTHGGEEELAQRIHFKLKKEFPELLTVIAPRHVGRKINLSGRVLRRSVSKTVPRETDFYLIDTIGELSGLYAYADVAIVGGSFVKGVGGHNPVEPVALRRATITGKWATEFEEMARELGVLVVEEERLYPLLRELLENEKKREELADSSHRLWREKRGVSERIVKLVKEGV